MPIPQEVINLIERFDRNRESYRSSEYNEAQVRLELINPFFKALGWDMYNEEGNAEAYKDVVHEDAIKIGGATKAPDYAFRIGGVRKFFVEAKRPGIDIKNDPDPAYQLRRYAWSAKLPLSILTDFEEFAVYDCRVKPNQADKSSVARVLYITYTEYKARWDEIASIFSQGAIPKGSFDRYAESAKKKRGTAEVDDAFLKEIENWRDLFARNIALRNPSLSTRELNYAVQRTVDRIIFLRICEDRGIETYGQLRGLQNGTRAYERLCQIFRRADERYNSGLFHFSAEKKRTDPPDYLTLNLTIDDKVLKEVFKGLYYPESPFEFSVLPADILGHIYEQFLGKVIRLTPGHRAKVEDKPEVKKAGGVYYTPTYIADYIVKNTVGKLLEGNTPTKVAKIRVLDPACGSGSFLLGAYQYLLDWHQEWYAKHDPEKHAKGRSPKVYRTISPSPHGRGQGEGVWRLTTAEKKRILLNNIYGVDIDTQAVEVTKLSLLLKVLEGENAETLGKSLRLFHERALPDLGDNIKCGNSLIGPDFYQGQQLSLLDDEERYRINAFDWESEFPEVFAPSPTGRGQGEGNGFDVVIGNPPYGALFTSSEVEYLKSRFRTFAAYQDSYVSFLEVGLAQLREDGRLGMIIPSAVFGGPAYLGVRRFLLTSARWDDVLVMPYDVFPRAYIDTAVVCIAASQHPKGHLVNTYEFGKRERLTEVRNLAYKQVPQSDWLENEGMRIVLDVQASRLLTRLLNASHAVLSDCEGIRRGVLPGAESLSTSPDKRYRYRYFEGDVYRYTINPRFPNFIAFDNFLRERPKEVRWFMGPRILLRRLVNRRFRLMACYTSSNFLTNKNLYSILAKPGVDPFVLLAILNSRLLSYLYVKHVTQARKDDFAQVTIRGLAGLPTPDPSRLNGGSTLAALAQHMLDLQERLQTIKTDHEKIVLQRQIDATDKQIDQLVYELYGLTDEEIRSVAEATA